MAPSIDETRVFVGDDSHVIVYMGAFPAPARGDAASPFRWRKKARLRGLVKVGESLLRYGLM